MKIEVVQETLVPEYRHVYWSYNPREASTPEPHRFRLGSSFLQVCFDDAILLDVLQGQRPTYENLCLAVRVVVGSLVSEEFHELLGDEDGALLWGLALKEDWTGYITWADTELGHGCRIRGLN